MGPVDTSSIYFDQAPDRFLEETDFLTDTLEPPESHELMGLSREIWQKFVDNKPTEYDFVNKINLWRNFIAHLRVCNSFNETSFNSY